MKGRRPIKKFIVGMFIAVIILIGCFGIARTSDIKLNNGFSVEEKTIPVLMYHNISNNVTSENVTPEKYLDDMMTLKKAGYTAIFFSDLVGYLKGQNSLPAKPVIITFDDGYYSNYEYAYPIAQKTNMKFTISVIGWSIGRNTFINSNKSIIPHFGWDEMKEMYDSGFVDIQCHTFDLHSPEGLSNGYATPVGQGVMPEKNETFENYQSRIQKDLTMFNDLIDKHLGYRTTFLFYPYGAYNQDTESIVSKFDFTGTVTIEEGVRTFSDLADLHEIPRINVSNDLKGQDLINKIEQ